MLKKMLSILLVILMLASVSVTCVAADSKTTAKVLSGGDFDDAYYYLYSALNQINNVNGNHYSDESYEAFECARDEAHFAYINAGEDMFSADDLLRIADELINAYNALEYLIFGDSNGDLIVNIKDATIIQKHVAGIICLSDKRLLCADINCDGKNNVRDSTMLQKYLAQVISVEQIENIELDFYIIDLRAELLEAMEHGEEVTTGKNFEYVSYREYKEAYSKAETIYTDRHSDPQLIIDATKDLKNTIAALIEEIDFIIEYEYRISSYDGSCDNLSFIARSPEEVQELVDKIDKGWYQDDEDIFPEKYDDAFFEENAVIVSLFLVGGSGCSQWIYSLAVDNTALVINRSVSRPDIYPPDMNYQLSFIEVNKADIEGVDMIIEEVTY